MAGMAQLRAALEPADRLEVPPAGQLVARLPQEAAGPAAAGPLQGWHKARGKNPNPDSLSSQKLDLVHFTYYICPSPCFW